MAYAMIGGIVAAAFLTLFFLPALVCRMLPYRADDRLISYQ